MNPLTIATEWLKARWQESAAGLSVILAAALYWPMESWLLSYVGTLPTVWLLRTGLAMLLLALASIAYALHLHPRLKFLREYGVYQDRKTGIFYCPSCLTADRLKAPLIERDDGWLCTIRDCHAHYENRPMRSEYRREASGLRDRVRELEKELADLKPRGPHGGVTIRR